MQWIRVSLLAIFSVFGTVSALEPPDAEQWQALLDNGNLERRLASAYKYENHSASAAVLQRAEALRGRALAKHHGTAQHLSGQLPEQWQGLSPEGEAKVLVFLIDFADHRASTDYPGLTRERVHDNIFGGGTPEAQEYVPRESMRNFYHRASNGLLNVTGETYGWYPFPLAQETYKPLDSDDDIETNWTIAREVLEAYDELIDYSQYDTDGDGYVDALNFIWSGERGEWSSFWWGYRWSFYNAEAEIFYLDGVRFRDFSWQWVELRANHSNDFDPRVISHEFGHLLGLPDLYDYEPEVGPEGGVGGACVMDSSRSGNFNAYFRWLMGWIEPQVYVVGDEAKVSLTPASRFASPNPAMVVYFESPDGGVQDPHPAFSEMLLIENRQEEGNDGGIASVPTGGLFLWHVDGSLNDDWDGFRYNNSRTDHKLMRLIQRDGLEEIEQLKGTANIWDLFHAGDALSPWTAPSSASYQFAPSRLVIDNIEEHTDGSIDLHLSSYDGPIVRVSPSHIQLQAAPGVRHPPSTLSFSSEGFDGSVIVSPSSMVQGEYHPGPITIPLDSQVSQPVYWNTADKPLHVTRERVNFIPSAEGVPPVSIPVQLRIRIPLEDALSYHGGYWDTGRHLPWYGQMDVVDTPPYALASGHIRDGRQSFLTGWVRGPGWVSFSIKVSSEENRDGIRFQFDGQTQMGWSGEQDWQRHTYYTSTNGWVQVRWVYGKDESGSAGQDQAWIDDFQFEPDYETDFEIIVTDRGFAPDPASRPFRDDRTLLEHYGFGQMSDDYPLVWPMCELQEGDAFPIVQLIYNYPSSWVVFTPQGSPDGIHWYTLVDGEEGVWIDEWNDIQSRRETVNIPLYGYRFFRLLLSDR